MNQKNWRPEQVEATRPPVQTVARVKHATVSGYVLRCRNCDAVRPLVGRDVHFKTFEWQDDEPTYLCQPCRARALPRPTVEPATTERMLEDWRRRRKWTPSNRLQERVLEFMEAHRISAGQLDRMADMRGSLQVWLRRSGKLGSPTLTLPNVQKLAPILSISVEQAIVEMDGRTFEDRLRDREERRQISAIAGHSRKGKPKPPEHTAPMLKASKAIRVRLIKGLFIRLARGQVTPDRLRQWADDVADRYSRLGVTRAMVLDTWRPRLRERGLTVSTGRPRLDGRHHLIAASLASGSSWDAICVDPVVNPNGRSKASLQRAFYGARSRTTGGHV